MTDTYVGRTAPWRNIKDSVKLEDNVSTKEMLDLAGLSNWNVRTIPFSELISPSYISPENMFVTVRDTADGDKQILGSVKGRYHPMQNEDAFYWGDNILDGGGSWDTAGTFNNSSKVFGCLKIDTNSISVDSAGVNDKLGTWLMVSNSHDGSLPLQASIIHMRIICQNTFNLALKTANNNMNSTFKIRHTATAEARATVAREALNITFKNAEEFGLLANRLHSMPATINDYDRVFNWLYPKPDDENKIGMTRWQNKRELIHELRNAPTNAAINNTAWGVLNTFTERIDWFSQGDYTESNALAGSGFSIATTNEKQRVLDAILSLSGNR